MSAMSAEARGTRAPGEIAGLTFVPFRKDDALLNVMGSVAVARFDGGVALRLDTGPNVSNALGLVHGGVYAAITDVAMFEVAKDQLGPCVTISQDIQYLRAAKAGAVLHALARPKRLGRRMAFCHADVYDGGTCLASASSIFTRVDA